MLLAEIKGEDLGTLLTLTALGSGLGVFGLIKILASALPAVDKFFSRKSTSSDDKWRATMEKKVDQQTVLLTVMAREMGINPADYLIGKHE